MTKKEMIIEIVDSMYCTPQQFEEGVKNGMKLKKQRVEEIYNAFIEDQEHTNFYRYLLAKI